MCPCDPADLSGNGEVSRKLPYGSHHANALAVNLNGGDVNAVSSYYGNSPSPLLSRAIAKCAGLGRLGSDPRLDDLDRPYERMDGLQRRRRGGKPVAQVAQAGSTDPGPRVMGGVRRERVRCDEE